MSKALKIIARRDRFRRAGISFGKDPVVIPVSKLDKKQIEALKDEPQLVVVETDIEEAPAKTEPDPNGGKTSKGGDKK